MNSQQGKERPWHAVKFLSAGSGNGVLKLAHERDRCNSAKDLVREESKMTSEDHSLWLSSIFLMSLRGFS